MPRPSCRRTLLAMALGCLLTAPLAAVSARRPAPTPRKEPTAAAVASPILARLQGFLVRLWSAEGCIIDPHGGCHAGSSVTDPPATAHAGCGIDPHGGCNAGKTASDPQVHAYEGCGLDPHGGCLGGL